jgi:serine phosphatase RsbU (regulator of sigma subunit)
MNTTALPLELPSIEKLREEELEEARAIQSMMMPAESLRVGVVMISHEFQPIAAVSGDFLDYFELTDGRIGLYLGTFPGRGCRARCMRLWLSEHYAACTKRAPHRTTSWQL